MNSVTRNRVVNALLVLCFLLTTVSVSQTQNDEAVEKQCLSFAITCDLVIQTKNNEKIQGQFIKKDPDGYYMRVKGELKFVSYSSIQSYKLVKSGQPAKVANTTPEEEPFRMPEPRKPPRGKMELIIVSDPPGASIQFNSGPANNKTPYSEFVDNCYFKGAGSFIWSKYLSVPLTITISKPGYVAQQLKITNGPYKWYDGNGDLQKIYYVVTSQLFKVKLEKIGAFLGTNPLAEKTDATAATTPTAPTSGNNLSTEDVVSSAMPAVVTVESSLGSGSGFFILESGVVVTNKHVVEGNTSVTVLSSKGESFQSESIFVSPNRDLALIKVKGTFPFIPIANPTAVKVGSEVVAIGSPLGSVLANTVTKGVISAFRDTPEEGIFLQTDASINPGNSGGPLLNTHGEVVGVNTMKISSIGVTGLNFALFSSEILQMLKQHFNYEPKYASAAVADNKPVDKVQVQINSEPDGAEIYVDGEFTASTPSKLMLSPGEHTIKVSRGGFKPWEHKVQIEVGSSKTFNAVLEKIPAESGKPVSQ